MRKIGYLFVHEMALLMSDVAMILKWDWLWEKGGNLELWADLKLAGKE